MAAVLCYSTQCYQQNVEQCERLRAPGQVKPKQGEGCETKCSLWRTKPLGVLPLVLLYMLAHESTGSVLVEVVQGCRGSYSGWTDDKNKTCLCLRFSLYHSCFIPVQRPGLVEQVSAACREELMFWWRQEKRDTHTLLQPASPPPPPNNNPTKKGTSKVKKEKNFMVSCQEGECWQGGQWKPQAGWAVCGRAEQRSGYSGQMGGLLEPLLGHHSAGAPLATLP